MQDMKLKDQLASYEIARHEKKNRTMLDAQFVYLAVDPELLCREQ